MPKILIIEDDSDIRDNISDLLEAEGYEVYSAENGKQGITQAIQHLPDLIICDVMMPILDGFSVLEELRQKPATCLTPFLFLTALADRGHMRQGMNLGADDYLTKPVDSDELIKAVQTRLNRQANIVETTQQQLKALAGKMNGYLPEEMIEPLSVILLSSEILVKHATDATPGQLTELGRNINRTANRLNRLIQNRLLISKLEQIANDPAALLAYQNNLLTVNRIEAVNAEITMMAKEIARRYNRSSDLDVQLANIAIRTSEEHLKKLVEEMLDNAFRYSWSGSTIALVSGFSQRRDRYVVAVYNSIANFDQSIAGIFTGTRKLDNEEAKRYPGLLLLKRIVEIYKGDLAFDLSTGNRIGIAARLPI
jgi:CheY-like chemotaxis protein